MTPHPLDIPQQVFMVFFAITWGTAANSQPRWKAFAWGAMRDGPTCRRTWLSVGILNLLPLLYFAGILWLLNAQTWQLTNGWNWRSFATVFLSTLPALAPFGFYRLWTAIVQLNAPTFYGLPKDYSCETKKPEIWQMIGIELKVESDLRREWGWPNFLWGLMYIFSGFVVVCIWPCVLSCITR